MQIPAGRPIQAESHMLHFPRQEQSRIQCFRAISVKVIGSHLLNCITHCQFIHPSCQKLLCKQLYRLLQNSIQQPSIFPTGSRACKLEPLFLTGSIYGKAMETAVFEYAVQANKKRKH